MDKQTQTTKCESSLIRTCFKIKF